MRLTQLLWHALRIKHLVVGKSCQPPTPQQERETGPSQVEIACVSPVIEDRYDLLMKNAKRQRSKAHL